MHKKIIYIVLFGLLCNPFIVFSQDSLRVSSNKIEEQQLKFQDYFFKALAQKAIENYKGAIQNLELCNEIKPNTISVLFEMSKNYAFMNRQIEAITYGKEALNIAPKNRWILEHLITVYSSIKDFDNAISLQEELVKKYPKQNEKLVYLYLKSGSLKKANTLLLKMEANNTLTPNLKQFKNLGLTKIIKKEVKKKASLKRLISDFESNKNFEILGKILTLVKDSNNELLLKYSSLGVALFPAQAVVYVMYAKGLNVKKDFSKALEQLQNGIDFVIDNPKLEALFYDEFAISYEGLGNKKEAIKSKKKALELRNK